jgi:nitrite reductase (NADH) small subunit
VTTEQLNNADGIDVGAIDEFPVGRFRVLRVGGREVGVIRLSDATFRAVRNICPHAGAPLCRGTVGGTMLPSSPGELVFSTDTLVVRCPWHAWEFDLRTGKALFVSPTARVRMYPVRCVEGRVVVDLHGRARGSA